MACGPITSWQIDWEIVTDFIFLGFKVTSDGDGSHEIKIWLLLQRKVMISLDSTLKSRDYFADKGLSSQSYGFFSSHHGCESWTTNKADCWRIDAFELWCWRLISVPWTARRSKLAILKEISSEYSLGLMLELKPQYFGHLMQRADSFEKTLMQGKSEAERRRGRQRMRLLDSNSMDMSLRKLRKLVMHREARCALEHWVVKSQTWLSSDNSELNWIDRIKYILGPRKKN